jgi:Fusaric acid resistance protein-like
VVNEPDLGRRRVTTLLMLAPAGASIAAGTLLTPHRVVADVVFVVVMMIAVYVRRFGPRGFALGMAAFMPFFFTQFLRVTVGQLPWLLIGAATGIGSTLLLRCWVFAERPERTLERLFRAFRAHLHALIEAVAELLAALPEAVEDELRRVRRRRTRLNETVLRVAELLEQRDFDHRADGSEGDGPDLALRIFDAELAAERLAVATWRLVQDSTPVDDGSQRALLAGLHGLGAASATGTPPGMVITLLDRAKRSVGALVAETRGHGDRTQRVAFAVARLADAMVTAQRPDGPTPADGGKAPQTRDAETETETEAETDTGADAAGPAGLRLSTRQAVQVGVATSMAIIVGELVSPSRWYWAVVAAFVVFVGTSSRGDVLSRGSQRVAGTIGGVIAGMGLAVLVGGHPLPALLLLFGCVFLALYLVRSQALMAFWITAVLALLYGLIGQFSVETLVVRIEETAIGAAMGILAGYLVLPKRTREAFGEALDEMVDAVDAVLAAAVGRILGREPDIPPVELAWKMDNALDTLRQRAKPLDNPLPRRRGQSSYQRALRVLSGVDHYARSLARLSDGLREPSWAPKLDPAADRVRANLGALRHLLLRHEAGEIRSAEDVIDAAEAAAARTADPRRRADLLGAARLLRRIDQAVVGFVTDIGPRDEAAEPGPAPTAP